jgi:hypothetical protein
MINSSVPPQVTTWNDHSIAALPKAYAHAVDGQAEAAPHRIKQGRYNHLVRRICEQAHRHL